MSKNAWRGAGISLVVVIALAWVGCRADLPVWSAAELSAAIVGQNARFAGCYRADADEVTLSGVLSSQGTIEGAECRGAPEVARCVERVAATLRFPSGRRDARFEVPLTFEEDAPAGAREAFSDCGALNGVQVSLRVDAEGRVTDTVALGARTGGTLSCIEDAADALRFAGTGSTRRFSLRFP